MKKSTTSEIPHADPVIAMMRRHHRETDGAAAHQRDAVIRRHIQEIQQLAGQHKPRTALSPR